MSTRRLEKLRRHRRTRRRCTDHRGAVGHVETLEVRALMSADLLDTDGGCDELMLEHSAGCACPACHTITTGYGDLTVAAAITDDDGNPLPGGHYAGDGHDHFDDSGFEIHSLPGISDLPDIAVGAELTEGVDGGASGGELAEAGLTAPVLNSNLGASATLFLDFDGHVEDQWGGYSDVLTRAYDIDGDESSFSSTEISRITEIWARVAEDFAPFDINVTTVDPGSFNNREALRVAIGGSSSDWYGSGAGGVAYINTFTNSIANVVYVFENNLGNGNARYVAEAASHEAGHGFGLRHQSEWNGDQKVAEYWTGENGWAPIMGVGYYQTQTTWYDGRNSSGNTQDDLAILSNSNNAFGYRADDHGSSNNAATTVSFTGNNFSHTGIVERNNDVDVFEFNVDSGTLDIDVDVAQYGANLDVVLKLYNANGQLMTTADPSSMGASITTNVGAGTYYLHVSNDGMYGALGQYTLSGTASPGDGGGDGGGGSNTSGPEVTVSRSGANITDGQASAISFGSAQQNGWAPTITFTVRNDGDAVLNVGQPSVPSGFTLIEGLDSAIGAGASDTFTVRMDTSTIGAKGGTIAFTTNDADEATFNFNVSGSVVGVGEIVVEHNGSNITDGSNSAIGFGTAQKGTTPGSVTFTVRNTGSSALAISGLSVPSGYVITDGLSSSIAVGGSDTFTVRLNTTAAGTFSGDIRITSNDSDESVFNFAVTGTVALPADAYENNDSKSQVDAKTAGATNSANLGELLNAKTINNLTMDDAADWFRFEMDGAGEAGDLVRIGFNHSKGDLDLVVYRADGVTEVGRSTGATGTETVSLNGEAAGTYYVRVFGYNGDTNENYTLTVDPAASDTVFNGKKGIKFKDGNGNDVNVSLKGKGNGRIKLDGSGNLESVTLEGTNKKSKLTVNSDALIEVHDVVITGQAGAINLANVRVTGDIDVSGAVTKLNIGAMDAAAQQTITLGANGKAASIVIGTASNIDIVSGVALKQLRVDTWTDAGGSSDGVTAKAITKLVSAGDFDADVTLTGGSKTTLKAANIGGMASGDWSIAGNAGKLKFGSTSGAFVLDVTGKVKSIAAVGDLDGQITYASAKSVKAGGAMNAHITETKVAAAEPVSSDTPSMAALWGPALGEVIETAAAQLDALFHADVEDDDASGLDDLLRDGDDTLRVI